MSRSLRSLAFARPLPPADSLGIGVSVLCALHCAAPSAFVALAPALSTTVVVSEPAGWALIASAALFASVALRQGYRRHGALHPALLGAVGFGALIVGELIEDGGSIGVASGLIGSLVMATGHLVNVWRLQRPIISR